MSRTFRLKLFFSFVVILSQIAIAVANELPTPPSNTESRRNFMKNTKIKIQVGSHLFTATLESNETAQRFKELLPMTMNMMELNRNEKYGTLPKSLPMSPSNPTKINNGDLMLYESKTLVLFYKTFKTSYSYTKLAHVNDITNLASALGSEDVPVTFDLE